ncbi:PepSY-associated TM helix domain-containing protein [Brevibacterium sp. RIT 803]|uniref:PepSY-associated TM helix domain-containing protein n=1 Tax=Brevibacterium sp. RIT 803 TaxID=2810210 RepID=UPI00194EDB2C|nr:PepSY-associated TM helix domain-containing protein [Brevibacterium sp. RIT 803]MBM6590917.1 PepSY domain-containing protein [Brevibacterium sp. RIT 803]
MTTSLTSLPENRPNDPRPYARGWLGQLLRRLHFYAGIFVGPFILIAALSGALYAISPQIEKVVYADELTSQETGPALPLADQVASATTYTGGGEIISAVRPAPEPGTTTRVMFEDPNLDESESRAIFVDPTTAEVTGDLTVYGTSGSLPLRTWVDQLHRSLHLGDFGRYYSELAASWLGIIAVAGLCLWVMRARRARNASAMLRPTMKHKGLRRTFSWHASVGVWAAVGMLFLSATGITWSQLGGDNVTKLRAALDWSTPAVSTDLGRDSATGESDAGSHSGHTGHEGNAGHEDGAHKGQTDAADTGGIDPADFDMTLAMARNINVNTGLVEILPPADAESAWVVQEIQRSFPTEVDAVAIDVDTMEVTDRVDFSDYGFASKLARWGIDMHMGTMFGLANQIVLVVLAIAIASMVVWGYVLWWQRRPKHDPSRNFGVTPVRGALAYAPWWSVAAVALVAVAIGVFLPMVGVSLLGFLIVDGVLAMSARRRARR